MIFSVAVKSNLMDKKDHSGKLVTMVREMKTSELLRAIYQGGNDKDVPFPVRPKDLLGGKDVVAAVIIVLVG